MPVSIQSSVRRLISSIIRALSHTRHVEDDPHEMRAAEHLRDHIERLMIMQRVETELTDRLDVDYVLDISLDAAVRASRAHAGGVALVEDGVLISGRHVGPYSTNYPKPADSLVARVLRTRRAEWVNDVAADRDYQPSIDNTRAQITVPLISRDRIIGVLHLQTRKSEYFTQEVFEFVKLMAGRIAVAIDNAQLYRTSQQQLTELQSLYARVSELERTKTDMIRIAAHDLRAPLSVINGFSGLLGETNLTDKQHEYLSYVQKASRQMHHLIHDILSVERIEVMQVRKNHQPVSLRDLMEDCYAHYTTQAQQKRLDYRLKLADEPLITLGDATQIREAIDNLIGNAVKYTPAQGRVEMRLLKEGDGLRVEVEDNGYGVPPELQNKLFQPFYRALSKETQDIDGTGLGLHLVKNIVERHNGTISFSSTYGKGSTFGFSLPLMPAASRS